MRIVIDLQACQSGSRFGGIGRYSMNLAQAMARNSRRHEIHLVLNRALPGAERVMQSFDGLIDPAFMHSFSCVTPLAECEPMNAFRTQASELLRERYIHALAPDVVHVASLFEGGYENVVTSVGRLVDGESTAVTLYDLIPLVLKDKYLVNPLFRNHYFRKIDDLKRAGLSLAISDFSRLEGIELLGLPEERVVNISSAVDEQFCVSEVAPDEKFRILKKYGVRREFVMYTGSYDSRKNHEAMIRAFAVLPEEVRRNCQILFVGNGGVGIYSRLRTVAMQCGLGRDGVVFAGKVEDDDLVKLYNMAKLFVFPSLREGFGLPVLEAMSCGAPVIASNTTSIPEVVGLEEALFNPLSIDDMARTIFRGLKDADFRSFLVRHGLRQAKKFSWDISAQAALDAFEFIDDYQVRASGQTNDDLFVSAVADLAVRYEQDSEAIKRIVIAADKLPQLAESSQ